MLDSRLHAYGINAGQLSRVTDGSRRKSMMLIARLFKVESLCTKATMMPVCLGGYSLVVNVCLFEVSAAEQVEWNLKGR